MKRIENECHFFVIKDEQGSRSVHLTSLTYSLGRSSKSAIVLPSSAISREHALLLRMPSREAGKYIYRLIDGNASGKPSLNGFSVNGQKCSVRDLQHGDQIVFADAISVSYEVQATQQVALEDATQALVHPEDDMNTMMNTALAPKHALR